jgi:hypothetical protein
MSMWARTSDVTLDHAHNEVSLRMSSRQCRTSSADGGGREAPSIRDARRFVSVAGIASYYRAES